MEQPRALAFGKKGMHTQMRHGGPLLHS